MCIVRVDKCMFIKVYRYIVKSRHAICLYAKCVYFHFQFAVVVAKCCYLLCAFYSMTNIIYYYSCHQICTFIILHIIHNYTTMQFDLLVHLMHFS